MKSMIPHGGNNAETSARHDPRLSIQIGPLTLPNPVMPASGCFGPELAPLLPLHKLGAVVTKTIFSARRAGNPAPRLAEVPGGMLNSVGIPSPGITDFRRRILPSYRELGPKVIVSIGGLTVQEYIDVTTALGDDDVDAFEVNVSCPNLGAGGLEIGSDPATLETVTSGVLARAEGRPVIVKLSPNVTSVPVLARAAEAGGAAAVTVANTLMGMALERGTRRPVLGKGTGGLSGPIVRPVILRMVWQTAAAVRIPVLASGGVSTVEHVLDYFQVGAAAVQVGTATFTRPGTMIEILEELPAKIDTIAWHRLEIPA
jgi:dihydroorotate dehydrogenase (NAD+) catalytic subunit